MPLKRVLVDLADVEVKARDDLLEPYDTRRRPITGRPAYRQALYEAYSQGAGSERLILVKGDAPHTNDSVGRRRIAAPEIHS
jgi:hypothetical protein